MNTLEDRTRHFIEVYKAGASPSTRDAEAAWAKIVTQLKEQQQAPPATRPRPTFWWAAVGGGVAIAAATILLVRSGFPGSLSSSGEETSGMLSVDLQATESQIHATRETPRPKHGRATSAVEPRSRAEVATEAELPTTSSVLGPHEGQEPPQHRPEGDEMAGDEASETHQERLRDEPKSSVGTRRRPSSTRSQSPQEVIEPSVDRSPTSPPPQTEPDVARLSAERRMLGKIRVALSSGDASRALSQAQAFRHAFPDAILGEEAALLESRALCKAGRYAEWTKAQVDFLRRYPGSPLAVHIDQDCEP